jgi:hypothetical protein
MVYPKQIPGTDVFVMSWLGAPGIVRRCKDLLKLFGHSSNDLQIELQGGRASDT